jgi:hypothetical protein
MTSHNRPLRWSLALLVLPLLLLLALLVGAGAAAAGVDRRAAGDLSRGDDVLPSQIAGTVRLRGCTAGAARLQLVADPLTFVAPGQRRSIPEAGGARQTARFERTADPRLLSFSILGLRPGGLYRLGVRYDAAACGKIFFRGPFEGLVLAGGPAVSLEGLAARTTIEVQRQGQDEWLGTDGLDLLNHDASKRRLRWRSTLPGVVGGELQVSLTRFPTGERPAPCVEPSDGVVYRRDVAAGDGGWVDLGRLDFAAILSPRRAGTFDGPAAESVDTEAFRRLARRADTLSPWSHAGCVGMLPSSAAPICLWQGNGAPKDAVQDCAGSDMPAIYYRDRWVQERLNAVTACTGVAATTRTFAIDQADTFTFTATLDPPPLDWRVVLFGVRPRVAATWNGPTYDAC